jgi:hypothetical protein
LGFDSTLLINGDEIYINDTLGPNILSNYKEQHPFKKKPVIHLVNKFFDLGYMESGSSLLSSQQPTTALYPERDESISHPYQPDEYFVFRMYGVTSLYENINIVNIYRYKLQGVSQ